MAAGKYWALIASARGAGEQLLRGILAKRSGVYLPVGFVDGRRKDSKNIYFLYNIGIMNAYI